MSSEATIALLLSFAANGLWQEGHDFSKRLPNHPKKAQDSFIYTVAQRGHHAGCGYAVGEKGEEVHIQPITGTWSVTRASARRAEDSVSVS